MKIKKWSEGGGEGGEKVSEKNSQSYRVEKLWCGTESGSDRVHWECDGRRGGSSWCGSRPDRLLQSGLSGRSNGFCQNAQRLWLVQLQEIHHVLHHNLIAVQVEFAKAIQRTNEYCVCCACKSIALRVLSKFVIWVKWCFSNEWNYGYEKSTRMEKPYRIDAYRINSNTRTSFTSMSVCNASEY